MPTSASTCALPWSFLPFFVWEACSGLWPGKSASVAGSAASSSSGAASASCAGSLAFPFLRPAFGCKLECKNLTHSCFNQQKGYEQRSMFQTDLYQWAVETSLLAGSSASIMPRACLSGCGFISYKASSAAKVACDTQFSPSSSCMQLLACQGLD